MAYSISKKNNFISLRLFYQHLSDGIFAYSFVNGDRKLETNVSNMGNFHHYGLQCTTTLKLGKRVDLNAYARYYLFRSNLNSVSELKQIENTCKTGLESSLSLVADLSRGMSASAALHQASQFLITVLAL